MLRLVLLVYKSLSVSATWEERTGKHFTKTKINQEAVDKWTCCWARLYPTRDYCRNRPGPMFLFVFFSFFLRVPRRGHTERVASRRVAAASHARFIVAPWYFNCRDHTKWGCVDASRTRRGRFWEMQNKSRTRTRFRCGQTITSSREFPSHLRGTPDVGLSRWSFQHGWASVMLCAFRLHLLPGEVPCSTPWHHLLWCHFSFIFLLCNKLHWFWQFWEVPSLKMRHPPPRLEVCYLGKRLGMPKDNATPAFSPARFKNPSWWLLRVSHRLTSPIFVWLRVPFWSFGRVGTEHFRNLVTFRWWSPLCKKGNVHMFSCFSQNALSTSWTIMPNNLICAHGIWGKLLQERELDFTRSALEGCVLEQGWPVDTCTGNGRAVKHLYAAITRTLTCVAER